MSRTESLKNFVFARNAQTVIPATPTVGVAYRNPNLSSTVVDNGWPFSTVVNSAEFNEVMLRVTGLLDYIEKNGGVTWSPNTDYDIGSLVRDDNFVFYEAIAVSGPNNGGSQQTSNTSYWKLASFDFDLSAAAKDRLVNLVHELDWDNMSDVPSDGVVYQATRSGVFVIRARGGYGDVYTSKTLPVAPVTDDFVMCGTSYYRDGSLPGISMVVVLKGEYYYSNTADSTVLYRKFIPFKYSIANS